MILKGKEEGITKIIIECDCGCEALQLSKFNWNDGDVDYYLEILVPAFSAEQTTSWDRFKVRTKFIWLILRGKYHWLTSLILKKEQLVQLRDALNEIIE